MRAAPRPSGGTAPPAGCSSQRRSRGSRSAARLPPDSGPARVGHSGSGCRSGSAGSWGWRHRCHRLAWRRHGGHRGGTGSAGRWPAAGRGWPRGDSAGYRRRRTAAPAACDPARSRYRAPRWPGWRRPAPRGRSSCPGSGWVPARRPGSAGSRRGATPWWGRTGVPCWCGPRTPASPAHRPSSAGSRHARWRCKGRPGWFPDPDRRRWRPPHRCRSCGPARSWSGTWPRSVRSRRWWSWRCGCRSRSSRAGSWGCRGRWRGWWPGAGIPGDGTRSPRRRWRCAGWCVGRASGCGWSRRISADRGWRRPECCCPPDPSCPARCRTWGRSRARRARHRRHPSRPPR